MQNRKKKKRRRERWEELEGGRVISIEIQPEQIGREEDKEIAVAGVK